MSNTDAIANVLLFLAAFMAALELERYFDARARRRRKLTKEPPK